MTALLSAQPACALPEPAGSEVRDLLREYVPLRVVPPGTISTDDITEEIAHGVVIHSERWAISEELAQMTPEHPDPTSLAIYHTSYTESLNEMIDVSEARRTAGT